MKKVLLIISAALITLVASVSPASAHVSAQSKGYTLVAGQSSRLWLSLGHGCTYNNVKYPTSIFKVVVPAAAGKPTPEFHYGYKSSVVASSEVDAKNAPLNYTVTWTAKTLGHAIDDGTFYDFGLKLTWSATPQTIAFPVTQTCFAPGKKPLYLQWIITDGSKMAPTEDTEYGPAPTVTTVAATAK
ncbi:MAG: DUF1775 domain-containing protein [Candidatus Planktophila sp.]